MQGQFFPHRELNTNNSDLGCGQIHLLNWVLFQEVCDFFNISEFDDKASKRNQTTKRATKYLYMVHLLYKTISSKASLINLP